MDKGSRKVQRNSVQGKYHWLGSRRKVIENEAERGSPRCLDVSTICHAEESSLHHLIGSIKCILNFRKEIE